jgi:hypothetical protein
MTTVRQIDRLWAGKQYRRMLLDVGAGRPDLLAVAGRMGGSVAAAAVAAIRLDELNQAHNPLCAQILRAILALQQADGGWGDPAVTALALRALRANHGGGAAIERGLAYLATLQRDDGAWPDGPIRRLPSDASATAFILVQLGADLMARAALNLDRAVHYLEQNRREPDPAMRKLIERAITRCQTVAHDTAPVGNLHKRALTAGITGSASWS